MTTKVVVVDEAASYKEIVRLLHEFRVSALPVVDSDGIVVGIVSEADLMLKEDPGQEGEAHLFETRRQRGTREKARGSVASQLMSAPVATARPEASLAEAARSMHELGVKRLPVVDPQGRVIGIVSRADLLSVFLREDEEIRHDVVEGVIAHTLWIDPATIRVEVNEGVVRLEGPLERRSLVPVLVGLVYAVEGVVGVENHLSHLVDDSGPGGPPLPWLGLMSGMAR
jgi:CBS domain-containing protein